MPRKNGTGPSPNSKGARNGSGGGTGRAATGKGTGRKSGGGKGKCKK